MAYSKANSRSDEVRYGVICLRGFTTSFTICVLSCGSFYNKKVIIKCGYLLIVSGGWINCNVGGGDYNNSRDLNYVWQVRTRKGVCYVSFSYFGRFQQRHCLTVSRCVLFYAGKQWIRDWSGRGGYEWFAVHIGVRAWFLKL
jgi:hypothetical protein